MRKRMRTFLGSLAVAVFVGMTPVAAAADTYWQ